MAQRSIYTRKLANEIAEAGGPSIPATFYIISTMSDKWAVVLQGTPKAIRIFSAKRDAISYARKKAPSMFVNEIIVNDKFGVNWYAIKLKGLI